MSYNRPMTTVAKTSAARRRQFQKLEQGLGRMTTAVRIAQGEILLVEREGAAHGEWIPWLKSVGISQRSASDYMAVALAANQHGGADLEELTWTEARAKARTMEIHAPDEDEDEGERYNPDDDDHDDDENDVGRYEPDVEPEPEPTPDPVPPARPDVLGGAQEAYLAAIRALDALSVAQGASVQFVDAKDLLLQAHKLTRKAVMHIYSTGDVGA
jgi:hypothetical protein